MRNLLEKVRKCDYEAVKADAQAIYLAQSRAAARALCRRWGPAYFRMVQPLQRDLPELLAFFRFPRHRWRKLRTTNIIERCFVEVRRRTRPMVCFVNLQSVERIIYAIFQRFNLDWKTRTLRAFTQADITPTDDTFCSPIPISRRISPSMSAHDLGSQHQVCAARTPAVLS